MVEKVFKRYNCEHIFEHSLKVALMAKKLAVRFNSDPEKAYESGLLHDIGGIVPNNQRVKVAQELGIVLIPEEHEFPMIIHQKISKVISEQSFGIYDDSTLQAIECHTTLRGTPTLQDHILFVADKIEWDQSGTPPYIQELLKALDVSIYHASFSYIKYLMDRKHSLKVVHPWLIDAHSHLEKVLNKQI
ncbi:bis(5'-nucleosyl)-tetraphosphatase (symmetrical) YqeK [Halalkalibacterium halodurans]|jgi:predicted HD superfamily hydrolase involved in NAD metabolism|uniref:bis(5'-nucleosyl)-tetraphosphatase (symmetrical) YqeK n=2 Tax=Halalkalibacterium halodurans TaxID=86665 RepID=UPI002E232681|nr:bis(5'-nucleosyl)-tetraphosphatase (symmetrical) YqeK [Halalkalibacterium halodurans]MED4082517.1 bis(5'-nucleosyl)-tetraphosphatase (symmetrical) YqeK [Halalkalibacterium halodurans]MED4085762.1 bis(5'-nucleosyl)-tetraphosphatase (symmetrical) YqeK [Halalkalibacterium halodurans]MED4105628.1 bis(5'-nucleosyl)-tetraphosphatase (symmetrical) YqeK [Halalkalibacterium halodurans]MED4107499.1 bis(5'-nucleosyl)-tetraphosphatase (symmetrical) YqeK [Halalkalibacterium halodurans]